MILTTRHSARWLSLHGIGTTVQTNLISRRHPAVEAEMLVSRFKAKTENRISFMNFI